MKVRAHRIEVGVCLVVALMFGFSERLLAQWSHWRGPEQNGVSRQRGLIEHWSLDGDNVLWESPIGGRATPIVMRGRVYLNCRTHHDATDPEQKVHVREQVVCWDAETGDVLWQDRFPGRISAPLRGFYPAPESLSPVPCGFSFRYVVIQIRFCR